MDQMKKSLMDLIDETIAEVEELKKSARFSAADVDLKGPGEGIDGKPSNGAIEKDEDAKKKEAEEKAKKEAEEKKEAEMKKAEEDEKKKKEEEEAKKKAEMEKAEGKNLDSDPTVKEGKKFVEKSAPSVDGEALKKSIQEQEVLMKSYVDGKMESLEKKISSILEMVQKINDQPVARKGVTNVVPLAKSVDEKVLTKSEIANKLFELKKSGQSVPTEDITAAELGVDLQALSKKYNLV